MKDVSIVISVIAAIVVFLTGYISHTYYSFPFIDSYFSDQPQSNDEKQAMAKSPITSRDQSQTKKIGETFIINNIEYRIDSAENLGNDLGKVSEALRKEVPFDPKNPLVSSISSIESYGYGKTAGNFVGIKFRAANKGLAESLIDIKFAVVDSSNRQYPVYEEQFSLIQVSGYSGFFEGYNNSLKPGFYGKYISIFETAKDSINLKIAIRDSSNKLLYYIPLGF
jgi:hypothetical protein